jgi:alkaline phosphatase
MKKPGILLLLLAYMTVCSGQQLSINESTGNVKNIILLIGDGMGVSQIYSAFTVNKGVLNLFEAPFVGFILTYSADNYVTDSGAGATAFSTGRKTNNYSLGVDPDGKPLKTILESAGEAGLSTGLVVTCPVTHATPAAFIAHQVSRYEDSKIAHDFIGSGINLFIGGGRYHFEDTSGFYNFSDTLRNLGYKIVYNLQDIDAKSNDNTGCFVADLDIPRKLDGRGDYLPEATQIALAKLKMNEKGFFIMIEGSQIDWGGHANDIQYVVSEMIDFDKAVGKAFRFADENPGTLVIVTADHETGGLSITGGDIKTGTIRTNFSTPGHTSVMVPVFAYGAGAEKFAGIYENTGIYDKMMQALGLK